MKNILEDLWYSYESQKDIRIGKEESPLYDKLSNEEKKLRDGLNEEGQGWLDEYEKAYDELFSIAERKAFIKGVLFGTAFMIETLHRES